MDYEQDEQEEQFEEQATDPQAEDMEIVEDDAPYVDLRDDVSVKPTPCSSIETLVIPKPSIRPPPENRYEH